MMGEKTRKMETGRKNKEMWSRKATNRSEKEHLIPQYFIKHNHDIQKKHVIT